MGDRAFVDAEVFRSVADVLGAARLAGLLDIFETRIAWLGDALLDPQGDRAALLASLHQSRGSALSLGFAGLDRTLAEIQQRLSPEAAQAAGRSDASVSEAPALRGLGEAMMAAWQSSLAAAEAQSPELRRHRSTGSNR